ncbi:MAG: carboxypeptidase regulatory-like domain-containing protein, partial [Zavarzinella sp.]|nr:carboxypeptidase regulatory-like domain-containing protein [Zavarzinella sp.]
RAADRRIRYEAQSPPRIAAGPDLSWREACAALHEELDRLPRTYRDALVLCYLEGLPRDEAARRLGWSLNVFRGRLERGRVRLRDRLSKRGITLSAGLLVAVTAQGLSPRLIESAATESARPSVRVAELAAAGTWGRYKLASALALAAGLIFGLTLHDNPLGAEPPPKGEPKPVAKAEGAAKPAAPKDDRAVAGRVLDPDGNPVAGARVWLVEPFQSTRDVAKTAADGTFRLPAGAEVRKPTDSDWVVRVVATHDGFGLGLPVMGKTDDLVLRLVKDDVPIRGRVLDLQGKPVAGATLTPQRIQASSDETLDTWLAKLKAAEEQVHLITDGQLRRRVAPTPFLAPVKTDAQGRFALTGVGRERLVELRVDGPTVAAAEAWVMTRATTDVRVEYDPGNPKHGYKVYHGATFDFAADPTQSFEGRVFDKATGKPIPSAVVRSTYSYRIEAVADADGKYTLRGLGPGEHRLVAAPPAGEPYLPLTATGGRANSEQPVTLDFGLTRAEWVEGTLRDARTKKPVAGAHLYYSPLNDEAVRLAGGDLAAFEDPVGKTDADGRFRIPVYPGSGAVAVNAPFGPYIDAFRRPLQGDSLFWSHDGVRVRWTRLYFTASDALAVIELDPKKPRRYELTVDPGETIKGRLLDPEGKPLAGCRASRLTEYSGWTMNPLGSEFEAGQVQSGKPRYVLFWHEERKLGVTWRPKPGSPDTYDVHLRPNGSATGRLADQDGQPLPDHTIEVYFRMPGETGWGQWFPMKTLRTDAQGRFELPNLPEGVEFSLRYTLKKSPAPGPYWHEFRVKSGEAKDLGDVKPK